MTRIKQNKVEQCVIWKLLGGCIDCFHFFGKEDGLTECYSGGEPDATSVMLERDKDGDENICRARQFMRDHMSTP